MQKNLSQKIRGMTLIEMLVVLAMFTVLMLAIGDSIANFYRYNSYTLAQSYQVSNARRGIEIMVRDIREMTFADDGTFPLARMEDHAVGFYSDIDRDDSVEYVEYELVNTVIRKHIHNATGTPPVYDFDNPDETHILSEYVQNIDQVVPVFRYYTDPGILITAGDTITDVRYIDVKVIVNVDPIRDPGEFMLRSSASLRNLTQ